jgi:hypothetical protein
VFRDVGKDEITYIFSQILKGVKKFKKFLDRLLFLDLLMLGILEAHPPQRERLYVSEAIDLA